MAGKVRYLCCDCQEDVTQQVVSMCMVAIDPMPAIVFRGLKLRASHTVIVTCKNQHTCSYPCIGEDNQ